MLSSVKSVHVLLLVINSTFNPIAYSLFKKDIKAEVKRFSVLLVGSFPVDMTENVPSSSGSSLLRRGGTGPYLVGT